MKEIWKDIEGYEGLYQVSNLGRVKSLNYKRTGKEKILIYRKHKNGYIYIGLCKDGIVKSFRVHRLVAKTFISNPNNYEEVNHKDEDKSNNCVENLEWCNPKYNANYGNRNEKVRKKLKDYKRTREHQEKMIESSKKVHCKKIICITTGETFDSIRDAGRKMKIHNSSITQCCRGKRKSAGKHPITKEKLVWKYLE